MEREAREVVRGDRAEGPPARRAPPPKLALRPEPQEPPPDVLRATILPGSGRARLVRSRIGRARGGW